LCITNFSQMPPKNTLTIGGGNPMPKFVYDELAKLFPALKQKVSGATMHVAEITDGATQTQLAGSVQSASFSMFVMRSKVAMPDTLIEATGHGKSECVAMATKFVSTRPAPKPNCVLAQIDGGADCCMTNDIKLLQAATSVTWSKVTVKAAGGSRPTFDATIWVPFKLGKSRASVPIFFYYPTINEPIETVISEPCLEMQQLEFGKSPTFEIKWPCGEIQPLIPVMSGYAYLTFAHLEIDNKLPTINASKAPSAENVAITLAATFDLSAADLVKLSKVAKGVPSVKMNAELTELIDNNAIRQRALVKRSAVKPKASGHTWQIDV